MNSFHRQARFGWTVLLVVAAIGCDGGAELTTVAGTITVSSEPVSSGAVSFFPADGGRPVIATLDANGRYESQLQAGDYGVVVQASMTPPEGWKEGDPIPPPPVEVPIKYRQPKRSPLMITVVDGPDMEKSFDLE